MKSAEITPGQPYKIKHWSGVIKGIVDRIDRSGGRVRVKWHVEETTKWLRAGAEFDGAPGSVLAPWSDEDEAEAQRAAEHAQRTEEVSARLRAHLSGARVHPRPRGVEIDLDITAAERLADVLDEAAHGCCSHG